jgi:hypothetical protein
MRSTSNFAWLLTAIMAIVVGGHYLARGDQPSEQTAEVDQTVALVDVSLIFKKCETFRQAMEQLKSDVAEAEKGLRDDRDAIKLLKEELETVVEPVARARLEAEMVERNTRLKVKVEVQKNAFMQRESTTYATTYREMERHVQRHAAEHKIRLVLRYNSEAMPDHDREKILAGVNRAVIYQDNLDITEAIIERLNAPQQDT